MIAWWLAWIVQGFAVALALGGALRLIPRTNAGTRCALWSVVLLTTVAMGIIGAAMSTLSGVSYIAGEDSLVLIPAPPDVAIAFAAIAWAAVAAISLVRVLSGVRQIQTIKRHCRPARELEDQLPLWLQARSEGRRTTLMISDAVPGAVVLGFCPPSIVIPTFLVGALTPAELDQIVLHEHAHVRRWDDWSRLGQLAVEALAWFHPAVRFAARQMNLEREVACDEWVVTRTGRPLAYARCLVRAAEARGTHIESGFNATVSSLGPALFGREHDLRRRVDRLLARRMNTQPTVSRWRVAAGAGALLVMACLVRVVPIASEIAEVQWLTVPRPPVAGVATLRNAGFREASSSSLEETPRRRATAQPRIPGEQAAAPAPPITLEINVRAEPVESHAPVLAARSYGGTYDATSAVDIADNTREGAWNAAAASISRAGRKTGVGIAGIFARAGGATARKF